MNRFFRHVVMAAMLVGAFPPMARAVEAVESHSNDESGSEGCPLVRAAQAVDPARGPIELAHGKITWGDYWIRIKVPFVGDGQNKSLGLTAWKSLSEPGSYLYSLAVYDADGQSERVAWDVSSDGLRNIADLEGVSSWLSEEENIGFLDGIVRLCVDLQVIIEMNSQEEEHPATPVLQAVAEFLN